MKKGFTLIELLGVIVILGLIALIAIPTINSSLNASKSRAYDEQITTIENVARTYMSKRSLLLPNQIVGSHTCIKVSDLKKAGLLTTEDLNNPKYKEGSSREDEKFKTFNGGVVVTYTKQNKYNYKYSNDLEKCEAGWGDKESGDTAIPNLSISVSFNTNYITVVANASADSDIAKYEFSKDNGTTWIDNGTEKIYTFKNLTHGTSYNIKVRVTSGAGKQNTAFKRVVIPSIDKPTFKESGTSVKTVTITYPAGCGSVYTCSYVKDNGSSVTVATSTVDVPFTDSGSLVARVSDGTNAVSSSYTVEFSPVMMAYDASKAFWQGTYSGKISTVDVLDNKNVPSDAVASWDVSEKQNKSVMAWIIDDLDNSGMYKLYIGGNGKVIAPTDSSRLFYGGVEDLERSFYSTKTMNLAKLDTSRVINMNNMFYGCESLTSLDVSNFDTSKVTDMSNMFLTCFRLTSLDVSNFDTSNVTNMISMFSSCSSLTNLDVSNFDTSKVTNMNNMFSGCSSLTGLDVSKFDKSNVTNMSWMFKGCSKLTSLDVSNFDTSKVTNMNNMFSGCSSLTGLDVSNFNTNNVTNMIGMFSDCSSFTSLDVSNFDTSNVTYMSWMFFSCSSLTSLKLCSFDTSKVINMNCMFKGTSKLTKVYVGLKWTTANATTETMFTGSGVSAVTQSNTCELDVY